MSVADAKYRDAKFENLVIAFGAIDIKNALGSSGKNEAFDLF